VSGTYSIAASGYGFLSSILYTGDFVYGLVNQQAFSSAAPQKQPTATTTYSSGRLSRRRPPPLRPSKVPIPSRASTCRAAIPIHHYQLSAPTQPGWREQSGHGQSDGICGRSRLQQIHSEHIQREVCCQQRRHGIHLPNTASALITGQKFLYISPDGNFVFGGAPEGWDMFVGVRTGSGTPSLGGLYYQAGIDQDESHAGVRRSWHSRYLLRLAERRQRQYIGTPALALAV
jgi:hypothetical protein